MIVIVILGLLADLLVPVVANMCKSPARVIYALPFGVVTVAVIYAPAVIIDSITIIVLRYLASLLSQS